jgi:hypothetical protein
LNPGRIVALQVVLVVLVALVVLMVLVVGEAMVAVPAMRRTSTNTRPEV